MSRRPLLAPQGKVRGTAAEREEKKRSKSQERVRGGVPAKRAVAYQGGNGPHHLPKQRGEIVTKKEKDSAKSKRSWSQSHPKRRNWTKSPQTGRKKIEKKGRKETDQGQPSHLRGGDQTGKGESDLGALLCPQGQAIEGGQASSQQPRTEGNTTQTGSEIVLRDWTGKATRSGVPTKESKRETSRRRSRRGRKEKGKVREVVSSDASQENRPASSQGKGQGKGQSQRKGSSQGDAQSQSSRQSESGERSRGSRGSSTTPSTTSSCSSCGRSRREVPERRRSLYGRRSVGRMEDRPTIGDHKREVLGRGCEPGRRGEGTPNRRRLQVSASRCPGESKRKHRQVEGSQPRGAPRGGHLRGELPNGVARRPGSWKPCQEDPPRSREVVDEQLERCEGRGGRDGCVEEESRGRRRGRSSERKEKEEERLKRGKPKKEEKEKEKEERKREDEDLGFEASRDGFWINRAGSKARSTKEDQEESQEDGEKKGKDWERLGQQQRQFWVNQQRLPGRSRKALRGGGKGKDALEELSRRAHLEHVGACSDEPGYPVGSAVELGPEQPPPFVQPILAAGFVPKDDGCTQPGVSDVVLHPGPHPPGAHGISHRCDNTAPQGPGADRCWGPLPGGPKTRAYPSRDDFNVKPSGNVGSQPSPKGGAEGEERSFEAMGTTFRLECKERPRERKEQGERRKRKEQEQVGQLQLWKGCQRRKGGQEKQGVRSREAEASGATEEEKERRGEEVSGARVEGSGHGPTRETPMFHSQSNQFGPGSKIVMPGKANPTLKGLSLAEMVTVMHAEFSSVLDKFKPPHGKTKCSGSIFPLPETLEVLTQHVAQLSPDQLTLLQKMCVGLNLYYGHSGPSRVKLPAASVAALQALSAYSRDVSAWSEKFEGLNWEEYLQVKSIDYQGEEVKVAKYFCWENLEPAMPEGIGTIPLEEVCELGTLDYVLSFTDYLVPDDARVYTRTPRIMVGDEAWESVCKGLLAKGVCTLIPEQKVYHVEGRPLQNGLFGVSKGEFDGPYEVMRLIMNLVPVNKLCRNLGGDVSTLPSWSGMSPYILEEGEVILMSSEDIRCFFYLFSIPSSWYPYMSFGRPVPQSCCPPGSSEAYFLTSRVLPMGFLNSVSIAQHVHRRIARLALHSSATLGVGPHQEIRKDLPFSSHPLLYRVYLDNFDILQRIDQPLASLVEGTVSPQILALREAYQHWGLPRHPKKSVEQKTVAEIQGAIVDGTTGLVKPKPQKVLKYVELAVKLLQAGRATQKQLQIVCGGFIYCCLFRRALLGTLNAVWMFIIQFNNEPPFILKELPDMVKAELVRFIYLVPLAQMNLRAPMRGEVTASDASEYGGGMCVSTGLTAMGCHAASFPVRGDLPELEDHVQVLTIGLFDGIGALRVSVDALNLPMAGHVSAEISPEGQRVLETHFPDSLQVGSVENVDDEMVKQWALTYSNVGLVLVGGGPPCQGVSGLNSDRKGALKDMRSKLFVHVPRVFKLCRKYFKWAQVHHLMESVASMDSSDRSVMSQEMGCLPYKIDAAGISLCRRPRLYWISWELRAGTGVTITPPDPVSWANMGEVDLSHQVDRQVYLKQGWDFEADKLPTFTTSRPRAAAGNPPYVYRDPFCLQDATGEFRLPDIKEKEAIMGFPTGYTEPCLPKGQQQGESYLDVRHTLIGNSWHVPVITWLLMELFQPLGFTSIDSLTKVIRATSPGGSSEFASFLRRLPLKPQKHLDEKPGELALAKKLVNFISVKGEDLLLQSSTENTVKYHRLRTSVPARLWRWKVICGWAWQHTHHHINNLELQATLATLQWRLQKKHHHGCRFLHLTDSLVTLHSLTRGRSSSRKLRAVLSKINALLLAADVRPIWGYVSTHQNPADRPSRRPVRKQCLKSKSI